MLLAEDNFTINDAEGEPVMVRSLEQGWNLARQVDQTHTTHRKRAAQLQVTLGNILIELRVRTDPGQWSNLLEQYGVHRQTAQRAMRVAAKKRKMTSEEILTLGIGTRTACHTVTGLTDTDMPVVGRHWEPLLPDPADLVCDDDDDDEDLPAFEAPRLQASAVPPVSPAVEPPAAASAVRTGARARPRYERWQLTFDAIYQLGVSVKQRIDQLVEWCKSGGDQARCREVLEDFEQRMDEINEPTGPVGRASGELSSVEAARPVALAKG